MLTKRSARPRGAALIVALISIVFATAMMMAILQISSDNAQNTDRTLGREAAFYASTGAVDLVVSDLWGDHLHQRTLGNSDFRGRLAARFPSLVDPTLNGPGTGQVTVDAANPHGTAWIGQRIGAATITKVRLTRQDREESAGYLKFTDLLVEVEARADSGETVWASRAVTARNPDKFDGLKFAILTNNITCSVCHLHVQNLAKARNPYPDDYGTFERAKVGTLELLAIRPGSAESFVEGTLYHRGRIEEEFSGDALNMSQLTGSTFRCAVFNEDDAGDRENSIYQQAAEDTKPGAVHYTSFYDDGADGSTGLWPPNQSLYLNYSKDPVKMEGSDGDLPTTFPAPFKDIHPVVSGNPTVNRKIDPEEKADAAADAIGKVTGGIALNVPIGSSYNAAKLPTTGSAANINQTHTGNLILVGTQSNPIKLDGKVMVEGDVMIRGYVEGNGQIWATGNIYAPGDVIYKNKQIDTNADGVVDSEVFGVNSNDTSNLLGMVAGGNIVIGDYLSQVTHWDSGKTNFYQYGKPEPGDKVAGYTLPDTTSLNGASPNNANFANFVVEELAFFNRDELTRTLTHVPTTSTSNFVNTTAHITNASKYTLVNPVYDPNYVPRYYSFYKNGNVPVYLNDKNKFLTSKNWWNNTADPHTYNTMRNLDQIPMQGPQEANAQKLHIHPDWITPGNMLALILDEEQKRPSQPRQLDGLLYTNNAIFAIERKRIQKYSGTWNVGTQTWSGGSWSKVNTKSGGFMQVNGALIAPDLGILVPGGTATRSTPAAGYNLVRLPDGSYRYERKAFTVNYDARVQQFLPLDDTDQVTWGLLRRGWARNVGSLP
ncbi:MAG: hypothetical protein AMXMBFR7_21570 [Planctomycetota bacterium]